MTNQKELKLGFLTTRELAEWFGVAYGTLKRIKAKKMEELSFFCDYELVYGGISIKKIHYPVYEKIDRKKDKEYFLQEVKEANDGLVSFSNTGMVLKEKGIDPYKNLSNNRNTYRMTVAGKALFGQKPGDRGEVGKRKRVWAIKMSGHNRYREISKEELQVLYDIISKNAPKPEETLRYAGVVEDIKAGEGDAQELFEFDYFDNIIMAFRIKTGCQLVRISQCELLMWGE